MADNMIYSGIDNKPINPVMDRVYESPMTDVREGAEDIHVRKYVAYGKVADHKLYLESDYKTQISKADAEYAFSRGMLMIIDGSNTLMPVSMTGAKVVTVGGTASAATLVEWTTKVSE